MNNGRLHITLARPDRMVEALALASQAGSRFSSCCLVYEDSAWWRHVGLDVYSPFFERCDAIPKVAGNRGLRDLGRHYRALRSRQRQLASLNVRPGDAIVCLAGITGLANAMASAYPAIPKVLCVALKKYVDASLPADFRRYRHTTSSWLQNRLLEPASGVGRTLHLKPWRSCGGDGVRLVRLQRPLPEVFAGIVVLSHSGRELPADGEASATVIPAPYPRLDELKPLPAPDQTQAEIDSRRKVVFFGTPFLAVRNLPPDEYARLVNRCLEFLRRHYGGSCALLYRPHPAETDELSRLDLTGFTVEWDRQVAELFFLRRSSEIEAVYSVSSTVSRVAYNFGLDAYCLWRCFPFAPPAAAYFESLMGNVPPEFEIRSLEQPPVAYARKSAAPSTGDPARPGFAATVLRFLDHLRSAGGSVSAPSSQNPFAQAPSSPV